MNAQEIKLINKLKGALYQFPYTCQDDSESNRLAFVRMANLIIPEIIEALATLADGDPDIDDHKAWFELNVSAIKILIEQFANSFSGDNVRDRIA